MNWLQRICEIVDREGAAARIVIVATEGPTPRPVGAAMLVWASGHAGKIGRGEVEAQALADARQLLARAAQASASRPQWLRRRLRFETGQVLGKSSGGAVDVLIEAFGSAELKRLARHEPGRPGKRLLARSCQSGIAPAFLDTDGGTSDGGARAGLQRLAADPLRTLVMIGAAGDQFVLERLETGLPAFHVYGTGLVARALVKVLADLPFQVSWLDTAPGHFPAEIPDQVAAIGTGDLAQAGRTAEAGSFHAVMTAAHDLDLAVTRAVLENGRFAFLGVIGSQLKRERMLALLRTEGVGEAELSRISCPIGLPQIRSKLPSVIAVGIAAQALAVLQTSDRGRSVHGDPAPAGSKA